MDDIYKNIEEYNPTKWGRILIVFDDMMLSKKSNPIVTELFIKGRRLKQKTLDKILDTILLWEFRTKKEF